ncbi:MAG: hypothetical protein WC917_00835, partial [Bacilli bacterium]
MSNKHSEFNQEVVQKFILFNDYKRNLVYSEIYHCFFLFNGFYFEHIPPVKFKKIVYNYLLANTDKNITNNLIDNVISQIKFTAREQDDYEVGNYISLKDGIYNAEKGILEPLSNELFITYHIPYTYDEIMKAEMPNFNKFLKSSLVVKDDVNQTDNSLIQLIKEMIGYFFLSQ